jgi:hypothetical protein
MMIVKLRMTAGPTSRRDTSSSLTPLQASEVTRGDRAEALKVKLVVNGNNATIGRTVTSSSARKATASAHSKGGLRSNGYRRSSSGKRFQLSVPTPPA